MASITKLGKGKQPPRAIDFVDDTDGRKRKRIRLGVVTHDEARAAKCRIEKLMTAKILNQPPDQETAVWLSGVSDTIHARIAKTGLVELREAQSRAPRLGEFMDKYLYQRKSDLKPGSIERLEDTGEKLRRFFGENVPIDAITADAAMDWRSGLIDEGLAEATARLHCRNAKVVFGDAVDRELIRRNPFAKLKSGAIAANRDHYVAPAQAASLIQACPNGQWRTLFGLARLAGLRCPSETHRVSWQDVDWERRRLAFSG